MEQQLLQFIGTFIGGLVSGVLLMLVINKLSRGSASASDVKQEYDDYQEKVESHFEETSKKFQEMTEQYQDLYKHLSVGATTLCRSDSVAVALATQSVEPVEIEQKDKIVDSATQSGLSTSESIKEVDAALATKPVTGNVHVSDVASKNERDSELPEKPAATNKV